MKNVKLTNRTVRSICATAMAMTLAMPTTLCVTANAAESSILDSALVTYDFEDGTDSLTREGETYLKLVDGKPVIENNEYVKESSTALPEVKADEDKGNVLEFKDSVKVDKYAKTQEDVTAAAVAEGVDVATAAALNKEYPAGAYIQQKEMIGGRVKLENPFKGKEFKDTDGVSISYWVKVPVIKVDEITGEKMPDLTGKDRGANSTTVVFNNAGRHVMNKDDLMRHQACVAYDEAVEKNDTEALKDYDMGTQSLVWDKDGNVYVLYENYGKLVRFNKNYPTDALSGEAASAVQKNGKVKKGGWYKPDNDSDGAITVTDKDGNTFKISSFQNAGSKVEDQNQYDLYRYSYAEKDDFENGYSSKSKIREGDIFGSLQITTDNDFGFREDNYRQESYLDAATNDTKYISVDGARITNPNSDDFDQIVTLRHYNQLYFDGDEMVTNLDTGAEKWHYVTIVIENDWVVTYVDGVAADPELDYFFNKETPGASLTETAFQQRNAGKMFNKGKGLRGIFAYGAANVGDWPADGTANTSPANAVGMSMLDWISDENTELYLGGTAYGAEALGQGRGTVEGVCLDDVSFFDKALSEDDAVALYNEVKGAVSTNTVLLGDVDGNGQVELKDAQVALKAALKIDELSAEQVMAADVDGNGQVELKDAQKILKVALKIDEPF